MASADSTVRSQFFHILLHLSIQALDLSTSVENVMVVESHMMRFGSGKKGKIALYSDSARLEVHCFLGISSS
jgi:hypothetical protein